MNLTDIEQVVNGVAEEEGVLVYRAIKGKTDVSEFKLAEKIDKDINATRRILYKLHACSLANFVKRKDQKKGWYIYYWTFNEKHAKLLYGRNKNKKKDSKKDGIKFVCKNNCGALEFEEAFANSYKCPECGELVDSKTAGAAA